MQDNPNRNKYLGIAAAVLFVIALRVMVVSKHVAKSDANLANLSEKEKLLKKKRQGRYIHMQDALDAYRVASGNLATSIENSIEKINFNFHKWVQIPEADKADPGFYFRKMHSKEKSEINIYCTARSADLDDQTLGFDMLDEAINNKMAQENLAKLSITRKIIELLADAGVARIITVKPQPPVLVGPKGHDDIMREYPVAIRIKTKIDPLMKFLHSVRRPGDAFLVVRSFDASSTAHSSDTKTTKTIMLEKGELDVQITVAGMAFLSKDVREKSRNTNRIIYRPANKPKGH